jgi:hypothetical protein
LKIALQTLKKSTVKFSAFMFKAGVHQSDTLLIWKKMKETGNALVRTSNLGDLKYSKKPDSPALNQCVTTFNGHSFTPGFVG